MSIDRRVSTVGIFFGAMLILLFYLLGQRFQVYLPTPLFFIPIVLIVFSIIYQVFSDRLSGGFSGIILLEIALASLLFHYIYQIPTFGLYGSDGYFDLASMKAILESGHLGGVSEYVQITSFFPIIHILGAELSLVTDIDYFNAAKWLPALIGTLTIPMIYLLVRNLFQREKAALLSAFLFASVQHYIMFGSLFVRETVAIVLAISCVYFYTAARSSLHPLAFRSLAIICLAGTILAHHLTSVMLLLLLGFYWAFTAFTGISSSRLTLPGEVKGNNISLSFLLMGIVGTLAYWLTTVVEPVQIGTFFVKNIFTPSTWGLRTILEQETGLVSVPNLRYFFLIYGSYISYAVFGIILLYRSFSRKANSFIETPIFTSYLVLCGIIGFMSFYLLPATVGGDRFLAFGWLFAFGPLALAIVEFSNKFAFFASVIVILFFIFINLFTIHPTIWDPDTVGAGGAATREDFALAQTVDFSRGEVLGYQNNIMAIYEVQNIEGTDAYFLLDPIDIDEFEWVIINRPALEEEGLYSSYSREVIEDMASLESGTTENYNRVYESSNLSVLRRR